MGKVINTKKAAKHFITDITDDASWRRDEQKIAAEAALDGIYVIRTSLPADALGTATRWSLQALAGVERVFRGLNTDLLIRPIRHRLENRVKAHVLIRTLACYVTWHMQQQLAPMLFKDDDPAAAKPPGPARSPRRSAHRQRWPRPPRKQTAGGGPVHSFATLLEDMATIAANRIQPAGGLAAFTVITTPTPIQRRAFELLGVSQPPGTRRQAPQDHRTFPQADALPRSKQGELRVRWAWRTSCCASWRRCSPRKASTSATSTWPTRTPCSGRFAGPSNGTTWQCSPRSAKPATWPPSPCG